MGLAQKINQILDYELSIDLNKDVTRTRALIIIGAFSLVVLCGYFLASRWLGNTNKSYLEHKIENLKQAISQQPADSNTRTELAMAQYLQGDVAKAIATLKEILVQQPKDQGATLYLGLILSEQKSYQEAIRLLSSYLQGNQGLETRIAYLYLGQDYLAIGKHELALQYLKSAAKTDPGNPLVFYYIGRTYEQIKDQKKAIQYYEQALKLSPNFGRANSALQNLNHLGAVDNGTGKSKNNQAE